MYNLIWESYFRTAAASNSQKSLVLSLPWERVGSFCSHEPIFTPSSSSAELTAARSYPKNIRISILAARLGPKNSGGSYECMHACPIGLSSSCHNHHRHHHHITTNNATQVVRNDRESGSFHPLFLKKIIHYDYVMVHYAVYYVCPLPF